MNDEDTLLKIQELLDGVEWTPDTLSEIADVMEAGGYKIAGIKLTPETAPTEE